VNVPGWIAKPTIESDTCDEATNGSISGVEGNSRLTSATGIVLLVLLAVEGLTILSVRQMITLHIFVGVLLLGPVLLKTGSTVYRFVRYYSGARSYRLKGPPPLLLRILGPLVIVSSLALLGTGIALIFVGPSRSDALLTAHKASFLVWVVLMTVHVLGHVWEAAVTSWAEIRAHLRGRAARVRRLRFISVAAALVIGVGAATMLLPTASSWIHSPAHHDQLIFRR
jgi:hypothetical protein